MKKKLIPGELLFQGLLEFSFHRYLMHKLLWQKLWSYGNIAFTNFLNFSITVVPKKQFTRMCIHWEVNNVIGRTSATPVPLSQKVYFCPDGQPRPDNKILPRPASEQNYS